MSGHGHRFNPDKASKLLDPKRKQIIAPEMVMELFELRRSDVVADLGAGNGYFTVPLAINTDQTVYAVDIEPKMLHFLQEHARMKNVKNIKYVESNLESIPINDGEVDKILIAFVIHEVPDRQKVYNELKRIKKQEGKIVLVEWQAVESEMGPSLKERIPSEELQKELKKNDFQVEVTELNNQVYAISIQ
ncbi:class I SAM-dependent methyltransferase [Neobacillus ginsengisoli]|uniref:Ubiquinone/menaquinone biosynthesis C-methylase UbiE n=1 Tax=Neobacillus ginsengisoli TaxID=904295 RepID=A0ABT9XSK2_9BACI|nr:class I SAM-dependent methyltransferase [Neobacillus ginsengisoli]MDQ0197924.1 ubiquinone/menaquinone biosynthesis C-methylase UbiE [Neobacillus ginsengisoli]